MSPPSSSRPLPLAAVLAAGALTSGYAGVILQGIVYRVLPGLSPSWLVTAPILYLFLTGRTSRRQPLAQRSEPATIWLTAVAAPIFAALAHIALAVPLLKAGSGRDDDFIAAAKLFVASVVGGVVLCGAVATWMKRAAPSRVGAWLALATAAALVAEIALAAGGIASHRQQPHAYVWELPVAGSTPRPGTPDGDVTEIGDVWVTRRCPRGSSCQMWVTPRGVAPLPEAKPDLTVPALPDLPKVLVRRDAGRDLWIVDASENHHPRFALDDGPILVAAFRGPEATRVAVRPRTLLGSLAPPRGWVFVAILGAMVAVARLAQRRGAKKALREILAADAGMMDEAGFITLERGGPAFRSTTAGLLPGPVLVVPPPGVAGSAYRTGAARPAERVLVGTRDALVDEARQVVSTIDARALAAVLITAAPLATAWLEGLR